MSTKTLVVLLLATLAAAQLPASDVAPLFPGRKIEVGPPEALTVAQSAAVAVPLELIAEDYKGPYDPNDPNGKMAAARRRDVMHSQARLQEVQSYIPPGALNVLKKEIMKVVLDESRRFAFAHPKEAAELLGIVRKANALLSTTTHKLKDIEKKQALAAKV